ncbi:MAG: hypothetical protein ACJAYU_001379 [Bradymonadia bacterium]|jgi:hypothetical protein
MSSGLQITGSPALITVGREAETLVPRVELECEAARVFDTATDERISSMMRPRSWLLRIR